MDVSTLIRDPVRVRAVLKESGDKLIATKRIKLTVPESYSGTPLLSIGENIRVVAIYGLIVDDKYYATSRACAQAPIKPSSINSVDVNGEKYMIFTFEPGDIVIDNLNLIRTGTLVYRIYNEFIAKGKVPWYFNIQDLCYLFDTSILHGNANLGVDSAVLELIASAMVRLKSDKTKYWRHSIVTKTDYDKVEKYFIPLKSVALGASNTTSKIMGAYLQEGITSALTSKTQRVEEIEDLLRS